MCGRYQLESGIQQLMLRFDAENRYMGYGTKTEIFPTDMAAIIIRDGGRSFIEAAKWGFDNHYDKRPLINVRSETVDEKRTFKGMFAGGRCIIPATAFFEWRRNEDKTKTKMHISIKDIPIFGMAGLYRREMNKDGSQILRCAVITTSANPAMSEIHSRMPVILPEDIEKIWTDNTITDLHMLKGFLKPFEGELCKKAVS